ncbi:UTP--glucose-1-phosphate uridylyltransferase [Stieleria varia]|uniref:Putative uridylyltransferase n=1 Tax=Stieleria varia TaxID=2528005 RepID=A0A5C6AR89_9BACT|nr:UTP--glucose-1-phosphate uridylyltransferase [Stieleria varia]TWU02475.1 putative uridylyltransferase [Stieleria varia]
MHSTSDTWQAIADKLTEAGSPAVIHEIFRRQFERLASGAETYLREADIRPATGVVDAETLPDELEQIGNEHLDQSALLKLNGGLGTSMGLEGPKSLLPVRGRTTFLELILQQTGLLGVPLVLMNSFSTEIETAAAVSDAENVVSFLQHQVPKLDAETLLPAEWPSDLTMEWCPPGHGDIYAALVTTGTMERLIGQGRRYLFVSNADNLGATMNTRLLGHLIQSGASFMMEVADRTMADRKGGHLAMDTNGGWLLRESAQCHPSEEAQFQDITVHRYFNTNNLWIDLVALQQHLDQSGGSLDLPMIANRKTVDPKDTQSPAVYQLETAMGAAIACLPNATAVRVPRSRFAPVKTTGDLLAVRSDAYEIAEDRSVRLIAERKGVPPNVQLDKANYRTIADLDERIREIPSLRDCVTLTVQGDVEFAADVSFSGEVAITNQSGGRQVLSSGEYTGEVTLTGA